MTTTTAATAALEREVQREEDLTLHNPHRRRAMPQLAALLPLAGTGLAAPIMAVHGLRYSLPITVFSALPAMAVPPERRAQGLGVYFVWFYSGCTGFPPLAGWMADVSGGATLPVLFAAALMAVALALFLAFRRAVARCGRVSSRPRRRPSRPRSGGG